MKKIITLIIFILTTVSLVVVIFPKFASQINNPLFKILTENALLIIAQIILISIAILLILRWIIYVPVQKLAELLRLTRITGHRYDFRSISRNPLLEPLFREVSRMQQSLIQARLAASLQARLSLEKIESPWTPQRLQEFIKDTLKGRDIFMVSNREPYIHTKNGGKIEYFFPASGMATAIEPIMEACGGLWIAHGSGNADKLTVDKNDKIKVPPDEPKYTLKRIWLSEKEENGYYYGFSNEGLWPLCHIVHNRPIFRKEDWEEYKKVNQKFADAVISEIKGIERPIIFVQDFHLSLVPRMIKNARPDASICIFWHIPWPNSEYFSICPWKKEILDGILGADLIGFHTQLHCNNFIETVGKELESLIDYEQFAITKNNHVSYIKPFPISIAFPDDFDKTEEEDDKTESAKLLTNLGIKTKYVGLGVDRLDYTKGLLERLKAIEIFLRKYPQYKRQFTFIQIAAPSRTKIKKYSEFAIEVENETQRINDLFKINGWKPIVLLEKYYGHAEIWKFYKLANLCLVTSLHDGMNLVAKEFVASRDDEKGVLILSQYTGASRELKDSLLVNPYDGEQTADAIKDALEMPINEQARRMRNMRRIIQDHNVYRWSSEILKTIVNLE
jgi:trehalose-6-phosphate synthase